VTVIIIRGDARHLPLADASVDLIVTSPPYYALRDYRDGDSSLIGQIGSEATPQEYVAALLECTREWMRVLRPGGSIFVNLGDKYSDRTGGKHRSGDGLVGRGEQAGILPQTRGPLEKSLLGLPWRYALGCIDDLGLILRAEVIWSKPNGLPESVTDRVRRAHETWFHFVRQPQYFSAVDEIREAHSRPWVPGRNGGGRPAAARTGDHLNTGLATSTPHALGALPGSVWEIATQPLKVPDHIAHATCCSGRKRPGCEDGLSHYAAFPTSWPRRIILGWSPSGICTVCGEGRRPVTHARRMAAGPQSESVSLRTAEARMRRQGATSSLGTYDSPAVTVTGYACACPDTNAPTRPALVVDPFGGTGTTALVADVLGRRGVSIDRSADYCRLAAWRTRDPTERARALGVPKPPPVMNGQGDLFEESIA
jgi:DNA modification methylase